MKHKLFIIFALCLTLASCNTDSELGYAEIESVTISDISNNEAVVWYSITPTGNHSPMIENIYICYSTSNPKPNISDSYIIADNYLDHGYSGAATYGFEWLYGVNSKKLEGLIPGTTYYVRLSLDGILYSDVVTFTTTGQNPNPSVDPSVDPSAAPSMFITEVNSNGFQARLGYNEWTNPEWLQISGTVLYIVNEQYGNLIIVDDYGIVPVYGITATMQKDRTNDKSFSSLGITRGTHITICGTKKTYQGENELYNAYLVSKDSYNNSNILSPSVVEKPFKYSQSFTAKKCELERFTDGCWLGLQGDDWQMWLLFFYETENSNSVIPYGTYTVSTNHTYGTIAPGEGYLRKDNAFYGSYLMTNTNDIIKFNCCFISSGTITISAGTNQGQKISVDAVTSATSNPTAITYEIDNLVLKNCIVTSGSFSPRKRH